MVILHSNAFKVTPGEDQSGKVLINRLEQRLGGHMMKISSAGVLVASVAVNAYFVPGVASASAAEGLDCKHIPFFHALVGSSFDKRNLLLAVDLVAQDVVASDAPNCFDGDDPSVELDFVAFHYFLDRFANVINSGIDASFLDNYF